MMSKLQRGLSQLVGWQLTFDVKICPWVIHLKSSHYAQEALTEKIQQLLTSTGIGNTLGGSLGWNSARTRVPRQMCWHGTKWLLFVCVCGVGQCMCANIDILWLFRTSCKVDPAEWKNSLQALGCYIKLMRKPVSTVCACVKFPWLCATTPL